MSDFESMTLPELERALRDAGQRLRYPERPNLSARVGAELRSRTATPARRFPLRLRGPLAAALASALLFGVVTVVAVPSARRAVAGWLGISGISIVEDAPSEGRIIADDLALGRRVSLGRAEEAAGFDVVAPPGFGSPDEVYLSTDLPTRVVTAIYRSRKGLPRIGNTRVGLLLTEFEAGVESAFVHKLAASGAKVKPVVVTGARAYWIRGPHTLLFATDGAVIEYRRRLAGSTLIWEKGALSLRLESALPLRDALRIARSM